MTKRSIDINIQVKRVTKLELDRLVQSKNESYDQIVQREEVRCQKVGLVAFNKFLHLGIACMILSVLIGVDRLAIAMAQTQMGGPIFVPVPHIVTHNQSLANQGQSKTPQQQPLLTPEQNAKFLGKKLDKMNELLANVTAELHVLISNSRAR